MKISIFGTGYVGLVTGACLANLGHEILCCDVDLEKIENLKKGIISFYEPNLKETVLYNTNKKKLSFTTDIKSTVEFADVIFNCVGTPNNDDGSCNLQYVFNVARSVGEYAKGFKLLVNKSTVPPGTAKKCQDIIKIMNNNSEVEVVSNPEFLKEGSAVHDFTHPDKIVVGTRTRKASEYMRKVYLGRVRIYIPFLETTIETAEMIKYANNAFLSTKISFINEIANICDTVNADVKIIAQAMGLDYRISPKFLNAGIGYGGSCFPKDVRALVYTAKQNGYHASLLEQVNAVNTRQKEVLIQKIISHFGQDLSTITLTILGLSFKPNTDDLREAPALSIIKNLIDLGAQIQAYDPIISKDSTIKQKHDILSNINILSNISDSVNNSSGIILVTEWDEFRNINFKEIGQFMKEKVIFDGRNIYEPEFLAEEGFKYFGIGRK